MRLIKRNQLAQAYNGAAGLLFSLMHAQSLHTMDRSQAMLESRGELETPSGKRLKELAQEARDLTQNLFSIPVQREAAVMFSDLIAEYNSILQNSPQIIEKFPTEDRLELYCWYRLSDGPGNFETFEEIVGKLSMRRNINVDPSDNLHLRLYSGNVLVKMDYFPESYKILGEVYNISNPTTVPDSLLPLEVVVSTRGEKTVYADALNGIYKKVLSQFDHSRVNLLDNSRVVCYCPSSLRLEKGSVISDQFVLSKD